MGLSRTIGIVIDSIDIGEADKILTIFTQRYGKVQAVAKGADRPKSGLSAASEFLALGDFMLYKGEMYKVNTCDLIETFYPIRQDMKKLVYASYVTEIIREVLQENERNYKLLQLYLNTLFCISETAKNLDLVIHIFELKALCLIGYRPQVDKCAICGKEENFTYFSFDKSGFVCRECAKNDTSALEMLESTGKVIRYIAKNSSKQIFSIDLHQSVLDELKRINQIYMKDKIDKQFKTLEFLDKV